MSTGKDIGDHLEKIGLAAEAAGFESLTAPIKWVGRKRKDTGEWMIFPEGDDPEDGDPDYYPRDYDEEKP